MRLVRTIVVKRTLGSAIIGREIPLAGVMLSQHRPAGRLASWENPETLGHDVAEGRMTVVSVCRTCGTQPLQNARFCHGCGSPVSETAAPAEYKQVTVLFADVVHSMEIAAAVGAERLREMMTQLVSRATTVVRRHGGTVDKFTGDGIMAVFGAPVALEDHPFRACRAALDLQLEAQRLAVEIRERDALDLQLRVGLNSGQVIAGEIGSGPLGYTAIGEQVGIAQRMESVAPPGGVMLSESTARLVRDAAALGEPELVRIKGADQPVRVQQLLNVGELDRAARRVESNLVGRRREMLAIEGLLNSAIDGHGGLVGVSGPPGIGKTRLSREVAAVSARRGAQVFTAFCESHTSQVPFHVLARLLRVTTGIDNLDGHAARDRVRAQLPDANERDLELFDELVGIADPDTPCPTIDPDARRRRLIALFKTASLARATPAICIVEDVHWIDEVSESILAELATTLRQTHAMVLITYRPEYGGTLTEVPGIHTVVLAPLNDSEAATLVAELLGSDPSVDHLADTIAERAAGNPFFAEEIVRDLAERGVLGGEPGAYSATAEVAELRVPATLHATIAARIDRLDRAAKQTLNAAAVIGSRFTAELLDVMGVGPVGEELLLGEFVDRVGSATQSAFAFRHPLIRSVAYESQLKADRAVLHRRVAAAMEAQQPASVDENAGLIAEHLEAAAELPAAYGWYMRAGMWLTKRDFAAARGGWQRAAEVADALTADIPGRTESRIAPRAMLCGSTWMVGGGVPDAGFEELRALCAESGDDRSMAIAMYGLLTPLTLQLRLRDASRLASEQIRLSMSSADPVSTTGVLAAAMFAMLHAGEVGATEQLAQRVIDLLEGDATKGTIPGLGSPLGMAHLYRGLAASCFGRGGWRGDLQRAMGMQRDVDPNPAAVVIPLAHAYAFGFLTGTISADQAALRETADTLQLAEECGNDVGLALARVSRALALIRQQDVDQGVCWELLRAGREALLRHNNVLGVLVADIGIAERATAAGDFDTAIEITQQVLATLFDSGEVLGRAVAFTALVEALLARAAPGDPRSAKDAVERLAAVPVEPGFVLYEVPLLRLRALLARADGDEMGYRDYRDRYLTMATSLGFEGHIATAEAMA